MPNWVFNYLTVEGNPEQVQELKKQVSAPYVMPVESRGDLGFVVENKEVEEVFSFWNIIRPLDMDAYIKQPKSSDLDTSDPNWWADTMKVASTDNSWYNWNNRNWGVKWDASDVDLISDEPNGENHVLVYRFDTPWAPPVPAMEKLSEQYPNLLLTLAYEEEQRWGGEMEFTQGKEISHQEYEWKCTNCDASFDTYPDNDCDDCYTPCPTCGWSSDFCQTHEVEYLNKLQEAK